MPLLLQRKDLFTNWSSEDSPRERANQRLQSARSIESRRIISQTEQTERESRECWRVKTCSRKYDDRFKYPRTDESSGY